jgi:hypothetical protein
VTVCTHFCHCVSLISYCILAGAKTREASAARIHRLQCVSTKSRSSQLTGRETVRKTFAPSLSYLQRPLTIVFLHFLSRSLCRTKSPTLSSVSMLLNSLSKETFNGQDCSSPMSGTISEDMLLCAETRLHNGSVGHLQEYDKRLKRRKGFKSFNPQHFVAP